MMISSPHWDPPSMDISKGVSTTESRERACNSAGRGHATLQGEGMQFCRERACNSCRGRNADVNHALTTYSVTVSLRDLNASNRQHFTLYTGCIRVA